MYLLIYLFQNSGMKVKIVQMWIKNIKALKLFSKMNVNCFY